jgi:DnaK suppressor protein
METARADQLLQAERQRVEQQLRDLAVEGSDDRTAANQSGDMFDSAEPLTQEQADGSVVAELRDRLAAIDRAQARLAEGTYGRSVRSGVPIPDERLEADPAAELTVEEARQPS